MKKLSAKQLEKELSGICTAVQAGIPTTVSDSLRVWKRDVTDKTGLFTFGKGYFYKFGNTSDIFKQKVLDSLKEKGYEAEALESGAHHHNFVGGAHRFQSRNSFFWVVIKIKEKELEK